MFSCKFDWWVVIICLFDEMVDDVSVGVQERYYVVDEGFPNELPTCIQISAMKIFTKATAVLVPMALP